MPLSPKRKRFSQEYAISGNATQSAIAAGYSPKTAYSSGQRLLKNVEVQARIAELLAEADAKKTATPEEVMQFFTAVLRGEEKDTFGLDASVADRIKAGTELMKRFTAAGFTAAKKQKDDDGLIAAITSSASVDWSDDDE